MSAADARANIIRASGKTISSVEANSNEDTYVAEIETVESESCMTTSVETEDTRNQRHVQTGKGFSPHSYKQKNTLSRPFLPSEVCLMPALYTWISASSVAVYIDKSTH